MKFGISVTNRLRAVLFFFAKLLHAKPKHASGEKRGRLASIPYCNNNVVVCNRGG